MKHVAMKYMGPFAWLSLLPFAAAGNTLDVRAMVDDLSAPETQSLVCLIGANMAVASIGSVGSMDGGLSARSSARKTGWLYVLQKDSGKWRVVALVPHDSRSQVSCDNAARVEDASAAHG